MTVPGSHLNPQCVAGATEIVENWGHVSLPDLTTLPVSHTPLFIPSTTVTQNFRLNLALLAHYCFLSVTSFLYT